MEEYDGCIVGDMVVGKWLGILDSEGFIDGISDMLGIRLGICDKVGPEVGKAVGTNPHSVLDEHFTQASILRSSILLFFGFDDLKPSKHLHLGRNALPRK